MNIEGVPCEGDAASRKILTKGHTKAVKPHVRVKPKGKGGVDVAGEALEGIAVVAAAPVHAPARVAVPPSRHVERVSQGRDLIRRVGRNLLSIVAGHLPLTKLAHHSFH